MTFTELVAFILGFAVLATCVFTAWCTRQKRRERTDDDIDQAIANVSGPVWRMLPCGCTWMSGDGSEHDEPTVIICARHWIRAYRACDYFHFDQELSK